MNIKNGKKKSDYIPEYLIIGSINQIIKKNISENNTLKNKINENLKAIEKFDYILQNNSMHEYPIIKFNKFLKYINNAKNVAKKEYKDSKEMILKNNNIFIISICLLKKYINTTNHYKIKKYLKVLLSLYINGRTSINNFFFILEIILISLIEALKEKSKKQYRILDIKDEPLLFINDIIESIINFPVVLMQDNIFIENLIKLFKTFFEKAEKANIVLKESELWLKLFENNSIKVSHDFYKDEPYQKSVLKLIDFLKEIYKNSFPKTLYNEIYKTSSIDFAYFMNILAMLKEFIQKEIDNQKKFNIDKGVYLLGQFYTKENFAFSSNEYSIILSFQLLDNNDAPIFNLNQKGQGIFSISIKNGFLNVEINNDFKWNTNIKINKKIFYFIIITHNKKNKRLKLFTNYDEILDKKIEEKIIEKENVNIPKFKKDMDVIIGDTNLYAIFGDILFINKEIDTNFIKLIFKLNGYYSNLIIRNNANCDLIKDMTYSQNYDNLINYFKTLKYEYILIFTPKLFLSKDNNLNNSLLEYNRTNCLNNFFTSKGIEFLTFMLHSIDSLITDKKLLDLCLYKIVDFISYILELHNNSVINYIFEIDEENIKNQLNIFFMTLYNILKTDQRNNKYFRILSKDFWFSLFITFSFDFENSNIYRQIILSILLDYDLFDQRNYINQINNLLVQIKINEINDELLYKIFMIDFICESNSINHKNFLNLINSLCSSQNQFFCKALIKYILKIESEIIKYHYLKMIYINIKNLKNILSSDIHYLIEFIEKQFQFIDHFHCKYCSYVIILCYLIKTEIINNKEDDRYDNFSINNIAYMNNPSNLFLKALFIENFNLKNEIKLKFIKSKNDNIYFNSDIFISLEFHPFELYNVNQFLVRFNSILQYIDYLYSLEQNENLKNFVEYFFNFIIDFSEKIKKSYTDNLFIQRENNKNISEYYGSKEYTDFIIKFINYDEKKAFEYIKRFINVSLFKTLNPFYLRLLNLQIITKDENSSSEIKLEIIKTIMETIINYKKNETEKKNIFLNVIIFLILLHKNIYQNEFKKKFPRNFPDLFINLYYFLRDKNLLLSINKNYLTNIEIYEEYINKNIKNKFICDLILDIILKFFFRGSYNEQIIKSLIIQTNSTSSIFYEEDENKLLDNINLKDKKESFEEFIDFSFCLYFLVYFLEKYSTCKEGDEKSFFENILDIIFNDLNNLYMQNKKLTSRLKKIKIEGKKFYIYNNLLDVFNKNYKGKNFNLIFIQEQYNQIVSQFKDENEKDANKIINDEKNDKNNNEDLSVSTPEQYSKEDNINNINSNKDNNINIINDYINNDNNKSKEESNISPNDYLKEKLMKIDSINLYFNLVVGNDYSKEITKIFFNPKGYYIWEIFAFFFENYIFSNEKFIKIRKAFKFHLRKSNHISTNEYEGDDNYYLNYPTKSRNYTIDEYYRPFLKPYMNFFNSKYLIITHPYIRENNLKNLKYKQENINLIKFKKRILPELNNEKYFCELFKNKGNIFGYIQLNNKFIIFKNSPNDDLRSSEDPEKFLPFIFSTIDDKVIDKDKYVLIFYDDIKEIIKRRVCLLYIGLEIFLKNNRSYMFNFFDKNRVNKVIDEIKKHTHQKNKFIKNAIITNEEPEKLTNNNTKSSVNTDKSLLPDKSIHNTNKSEINFKLIEDPISEFKKLQLQSKNKKGILSNFDYLLLINKYSSRTYNDYNQYLVFPLLFKDGKFTTRRDLSKVVSMNKKDNKAIYNKIEANYSLYKFHFNQHYSTGGFILYYLIRLIPFTYQHILFQSMRFDAPARLFSSLNNVFNILEATEDNRELIPEFFFSFEFLLNLNYNDFGLLETTKETYYINHADTNCKYSFPEYIIKSRNYLEQSDLSPWIDYIFGAKQTIVSDESPCLFNLNTYEEFSELEKIKEEDKPLEEKVEELKEKIEIFKFGTTPAKLFNKLHEKMTTKNIEKEDDFISFDKKEEKSINIINKYIQKKIKEKVDFYFINTKNNNDIELIFIYRNKIDIFKLKFGESKYTEISQKIQEQINYESKENSLCEVFPDIYCIVRHIDNTISFIIKDKEISIYNFYCLVTSVENKYNNNSEEKLNKEIFLGDERGFLHLVEINFDFNQKQKIHEIKNIKIKKSTKVHEGSIIGLSHIQRLNVIISWSDENEDCICINNDYDLNLMNLIKIGKEIEIKEVLVSKYDLIYISCYEKKTKNYQVYSYTLNGIKVSLYESPEKIIKCFVDEKVNIVFKNNNGLSFYLYTFDEIFSNFYCDFTDDFQAFTIKINNCQYYPQNKKYLMICSDNKASFFNNDKGFI